MGIVESMLQVDVAAFVFKLPRGVEIVHGAACEELPTSLAGHAFLLYVSGGPEMLEAPYKVAFRMLSPEGKVCLHVIQDIVLQVSPADGSCFAHVRLPLDKVSLEEYGTHYLQYAVEGEFERQTPFHFSHPDRSAIAINS